MNKTVLLIHGQNIELEERICSGGCGCKFKVMPGSKNTTARMDCQQVCFGEKWAQMQTRFKDKQKVQREMRKLQVKTLDPDLPVKDQLVEKDEPVKKKKSGRPVDHDRKYHKADRLAAAKEFLKEDTPSVKKPNKPGAGRPRKYPLPEKKAPKITYAGDSSPNVTVIPAASPVANDPLAAPAAASLLFWESCLEKVLAILASESLSYANFVEMAAWIDLAVVISMRNQSTEILFISERIKVEPESIHRWIKIKSKVYPHLSGCDDDHLLAKVADRVQDGMSNGDIQLLFKEESKHLVNKCLSDLIKIENLICRSSLDLSVLSGDELNKFKSALAGLSKTLKASV